MRKNLLLTSTVLLLILFIGCSKGNYSTIDGTFYSLKNETVMIEELAPGKTILLDSIKINNKGKFNYKYKFIDENPIFIRLRVGQDFVTLLISPNEKIDVESILNMSDNYTVTGSPGSTLVCEINQALMETNQTIDDLILRYKATTIESEREEINILLNQRFVHLRRHCVEFLVRNSKSLASVMVLYQTYPNGQHIFGGEHDYLFFNKVADSLKTVYPTSPHVKQLVNSIDDYNQRTYRLANLVKTSKSIPEVNLPDIYGNKQSLADLVGKKTVLLVFWSASDPSSAMINRELKELYSKYKNQDFEIFQVSLDLDKTLWLERVIETNLPWINVRDGAGPTRSVPALTYQVKVLPSNFLINLDGVPEYKNLWGNQLESKIKEVLE